MDATKGSNPILSNGATLVISGKVYRIPRIGWKDMFRIFRFAQDLAKTGAVQSSLLDHQNFDPAASDTSDFFTNLAYGALASEEKIYDFLSPLVLQKTDRSDASGNPVWTPVSVEDLQDPDKFPADSLLQILLTLGQHPDVIAFFKRWVDMQSALIVASKDLLAAAEMLKT